MEIQTYPSSPTNSLDGNINIIDENLSPYINRMVNSDRHKKLKNDIDLGEDVKYQCNFQSILLPECIKIINNGTTLSCHNIDNKNNKKKPKYCFC